MQVERHQDGSPTTRLTPRRAGNLSRGHQNTRKILKKKKLTDTQHDYKARFDGQRIGKLKVATWNVRRTAEETEELQTELLKRKIDIAIITETNKKNKGLEDMGNYVMIYCGVPANQWALSGVVIAIRKDWKHKLKDYT
jgi:NTP pyrophosphatase (non-canonical NTP hydrolase)